MINYLRKIKNILVTSYYMRFYYKKRLQENLILIESKKGEDFAGNIVSIVKELLKDEYSKYIIVISCYDRARHLVEEKIGKNSRVKYVETASFKYFKLLAIAKYLFTDTTFPKMYIKKEGQVITNTWHGTPLKNMGKDVALEAYSIGNVQRNLLMSDYLIYPNEFMKEKMISAFMLDGIYQGTILCEGYPRNSIFLDIKEERKKSYVYMPTWRGIVNKVDNKTQVDYIKNVLNELDSKLENDEKLYVKLHTFVTSAIDFSNYKHVEKFPKVDDEYKFLGECECLITDYSSVMFDYLNTRKKIVLFTYDEEEYLSNRGLYLQLSELPFPNVKDVDNLLEAIRCEKSYDDTQLLERFCTYENKNATSNICKHVLLGEKICKEERIYRDDKENVVMYPSSLAKSGLTTAFCNLLESVDSSKRNYYVSFRENALKKFPDRVEKIPSQYNYLPIASDPNFTFMEAVCYAMYFMMNKDCKFIMKYLDRLFKREVLKSFSNVKVDCAIQYSGYERGIINLFERFDCKRVIFVHNDMVEEIRTRGNQHYKTLQKAYNNYDAVAVVTEDIKNATLQISGKEENIVVVNNTHDYKNGIIKAKSDVVFDDDTECNISKERLIEILNDKTKKKVITIGRFSPEKAHKRLIDAVDKIYKDNKDVYLIIIGGHGDLYKETLQYAKSLDSSENIIIVKSISNPYCILKDCDLFVLSSLYEGLGLVILEADTVNVPVISTDITGPRGFMKKYGGKLVESSEQGIEQGIREFLENGLEPLNVDYEVYNKDCVAQFEKMIENLFDKK